MPINSPGTKRGWLATPAACVLLAALAGCTPHMYDEVPAVQDAKRSEVSGTWIGAERTNVVLRPDGKADIRLLDGQEWDFDERWRLSGTGTWQLTDEPAGWNDGRHVRLTLTSRTSVAQRVPDPDEPVAPMTEEPETPTTYTWTFELRRDRTKALGLYFFFGDPDSRSTYALEREAP
ncbi:hypothetical protein [Streptomyces fructofermentans]|uniref:hypothetical protein n=1 Tax=Streptomyces fructofermentans TaxID=152141 RepID=UPI00378E7567